MLIGRNEHLGNIKDIEISNNGPLVTHLLFANDLILCGPATTQNAQPIADCLIINCSWSGRKINSAKSSIQISRNTATSTIKDIKEIQFLNFLLQD